MSFNCYGLNQIAAKYLVLYLTRDGASLDNRSNDSGYGLNATVFLRTLGQSESSLQSRLYFDCEHRLSVGTMITCGNTGYQNTTQRRRVFVTNLLARRQQMIQQERQYATVLLTQSTNTHQYATMSLRNIKSNSDQITTISGTKNLYLVFAY